MGVTKVARLIYTRSHFSDIFQRSLHTLGKQNKTLWEPTSQGISLWSIAGSEHSAQLMEGLLDPIYFLIITWRVKRGYS